MVIRILLCCVVVSAAAHFGPASAQPLAEKPSVFKIGSQFRISAQEEIVWDRNRKVLIAQGNVVLFYRGNKLYADKAFAYYRLDAGDRQKFYKFTAIGSVRLTASEYEIVGSKLTYDIITQTANMIGRSKVVFRRK